MLLIILALFLGLLTGLIPGLHPNTLTSVLLSLNIDSPDLPFAIIAMFAVHSIIAYIPSIFLGIPDSTVVLSVLPGHRMAMKGEGLKALSVMVVSAIFAVLLCIALFPVSQALYPIVFPAIQPYLFHILLVASAVLVLRSRNPLGAILIFVLAGIIGKQAFSLGLPDPFLPLFTGMFAMAAIFTYSNAKLPEQKLPKRIGPSILRYAAIGVALGWIADLLPGISSPAQVAAFASILIPFTGVAYLATIASIGVSESIFAFSTASTLDKARIGAIAEASKITPIQDALLPYLSIFIIGIVFACILVYFFRPKIGEISKINFTVMNAMLAIYLILVVFLIDSLPGMMLFFVATALGYLCIRLNVERTILMGAIIVPTILLLF
jgi:putative membrane protein